MPALQERIIQSMCMAVVLFSWCLGMLRLYHSFRQKGADITDEERSLVYKGYLRDRLQRMQDARGLATGVMAKQRIKRAWFEQIRTVYRWATKWTGIRSTHSNRERENGKARDDWVC